MTIKEDIEFLRKEIEALKNTNLHLGNIVEKLNNKMDYLVDYTTGSWEIKDKQLFIYDTKGDILETYDLLTQSGNPTNTNPFKRVLK